VQAVSRNSEHGTEATHGGSSQIRGQRQNHRARASQRKASTTASSENPTPLIQKIVDLTAYDYPTAAAPRTKWRRVLSSASLAMVAIGYDSTRPVTLDEMIPSRESGPPRNKRALCSSRHALRQLSLGPPRNRSAMPSACKKPASTP